MGSCASKTEADQPAPPGPRRGGGHPRGEDQTMTMPAPTVLVDGLHFPECPRWREDKLWFSDILGQKVLTTDLAGHVEEVVAVPALPAGLGFLPDGQLLVASQRDRRVSRLAAGNLQLVVDLADQEPEPARLNDMVVDAEGRAYVGVVFGSG